MDRRGLCREEIARMLRVRYDEIVEDLYRENYIDAIQYFDDIAENRLRQTLSYYYKDKGSMDQAWRSCKGELYEYAVYKAIKNIVSQDNILRDRIRIVIGSEIDIYRNRFAIRNWSEIYPDADIVIIDSISNEVKAIISCKTSLRERLAETAFWKRELERFEETRDVKIIFITTDKDDELRIETNRYIAMHVLDYTIITDIYRYRSLMNYLRIKYGNREDFDQYSKKIRTIKDFGDILKTLIK